MSPETIFRKFQIRALNIFQQNDTPFIYLYYCFPTNPCSTYKFLLHPLDHKKAENSYKHHS